MSAPLHGIEKLPPPDWLKRRSIILGSKDKRNLKTEANSLQRNHSLFLNGRITQARVSWPSVQRNIRFAFRARIRNVYGVFPVVDLAVQATKN